MDMPKRSVSSDVRERCWEGGAMNVMSCYSGELVGASDTVRAATPRPEPHHRVLRSAASCTMLHRVVLSAGLDRLLPK